MNEHDLERISAHLDGTLSPDEERRLARELAERPELAAELEALRSQDRALTAAIAPLRRAVVRRAAALGAPQASEPTSAGRGSRHGSRLPPWAWLLTGAAAGTLLTGSLLGWGNRGTGPAGMEEPRGLARLERALGPVELLTGGGLPAVLAAGAVLEPGALLRTAARAKCTLLLAEGSRLLLDGETEVELSGPRRITLRRGRVYAEITPDSERFVAQAGPSRVEVLGTRLDLHQHLGVPGSAEAGRELTELAVLEGQALLCGTPVEAGSLATALDGRFEHAREASDLYVLTSWVNELLAFEPGHSAEFQERVNALLAQIGQTKVTHLYESEIRSLGDHCALPLLRYVESEGSLAETARRRRAARILADVATLEQADALAQLLTDSDAEVRVDAARALARLTGGPPGAAPQDFAEDGYETLAELWRTWLVRR